jgi:hypothetical protein
VDKLVASGYGRGRGNVSGCVRWGVAVRILMLEDRFVMSKVRFEHHRPESNAEAPRHKYSNESNNFLGRQKYNLTVARNYFSAHFLSQSRLHTRDLWFGSFGFFTSAHG